MPPNIQQLELGNALLITTGLVVFITCLFMAGFMVGFNRRLDRVGEQNRYEPPRGEVAVPRQRRDQIRRELELQPCDPEEVA